MEDKKISVIVPVYNAAKYVQTCVDSILNQTYTNLELILVDDGSKDESPALLDEIKSKDPRVVVIHKENGGVSAARNDGIVASTGEYIHFIDSDDWLDKTCYEDMIALMVKEDADVAYFGWSKDNVYKTAFVQSKEGFTGVGGQSEILKYMLSLVGVGGGYVSYGNYVWNKIYKKASLKDCNGNFVLFPTDVSIAEDGLWLVEAAKNFKKGVFNKTPYYHYYQNPDSVMNTKEKYFKTRLGSESAHVKMVKIVEAYNKEMADLHKEVCNSFFLSHIDGAPEKDPEFIEAVFNNLIELNDGKCPASLAKKYAALLNNVPKDAGLLNRKLVRMAVKVTKKIDKKRKG